MGYRELYAQNVDDLKDFKKKTLELNEELAKEATLNLTVLVKSSGGNIPIHKEILGRKFDDLFMDGEDLCYRLWDRIHPYRMSETNQGLVFEIADFIEKKFAEDAEKDKLEKEKAEK